MIRFVEHKNIDRSKWDECIEASPDGNIFVCSWYLDSLATGWSALVQDEYTAVFPLAGSVKYRISYLYQPFFSRYFGVYSKFPVTTEITDRFLKSIPEKFRYMEFCMHEQNAFSTKEFEIQTRKYQILDLNPSYEVLLGNYNDNSRRSIKKALRSGYSIKENIPGDVVVDLFRKTKGRELEVFDSKDYKVLSDLMAECTKRSQSESFGIYNSEGELSAAAFFMRYKNRYIFLKSGVTDFGKNNGYMHLLFDAFIKKHAKTNTVLDFGGSSVDSVARFYKNFGAKDCVYLQVKKNRLPRLVNWLKSLKK
jgi:hypothetical protein